MIVVDSSVVVSALAESTETGRVARARMGAASDIAAPQLLDLEVVSVLRRLAAAKVITRKHAEIAVADLGELDVDRWDHGGLVQRVWQLRNSLSAYDASYVALAEELGCTLLTGDAKLAKGAEHAKSPAQVEVLTG
jgi:predicted nucleic acid-binding protein